MHGRQVLCVPACHAQTVVAQGFFPRVMRSYIARFAVCACGRSSFGQELMVNNEQLNSAVDQDTAIGLTEQRLQSMLEAAAKSAAAQAVAALATRGVEQPPLLVLLHQVRSLLHYRYLLTSGFFACRLYIGARTGWIEKLHASGIGAAKQ